MPFNDAFDFVKMRREKIDPNEGFIEQLKEFEEKKMEFGHHTYEVNDAVPCIFSRRKTTCHI